MTAMSHKAAAVARALAKAVFVLSFAAPGADAASGLWGAENLITGPCIKRGDTVTIVCGRRERARPGGDLAADADATRPAGGKAAKARPAKTGVHELAARVVKVLPNGNIVLEVRLRIGSGSILLGGEAARIDICSAERTVPLSRLSNLAVVTRGIDDGILGGILALARGARVARAGTKKTTK